MIKRSSKPPATKTFPDHEVLVPHNTLAVAIATGGSGNAEADLIARAETALVQLAENFPSWMQAECDRLSRVRTTARNDGLTDSVRLNLFRAAHDLRGQAATFGFPAAAEAADSLCRLLEHAPEPDRIPQTLIDQHVDGIRAIARETADRRNGSVAQALCTRLRQVTDAFLVDRNAHRPDYLEDLIGPTLVPTKAPM